MTNEELLTVANYNPGGCLCGHFESCPVCSRGDRERTFEHLAKQAAIELLKARGIELEEDPGSRFNEFSSYNTKLVIKPMNIAIALVYYDTEMLIAAKPDDTLRDTIQPLLLKKKLSQRVIVRCADGVLLELARKNSELMEWGIIKEGARFFIDEV